MEFKLPVRSTGDYGDTRVDSELLRLLYDVNPTLVFVKDRQGRFVFANMALAEVYGTEVEHLLGKTDADFNPDIEEIEHFLIDDLKVMDSQQELFIAQEKVTGPDGNSVWLQTIKRPLIGENGVSNHLLGVCVDITKRIEAEQRELKLRERLAHSERLNSLGVLAGGIAHDLNNILGPLVGYPDLIRMQVDDQNVHKLIDEMQRSAERATSVIDDLLTLARRGTYKAQPVSPGSCLNDFVSSAALNKILEDNPHAKLSLDLEERIPSILGSESHVHQVLLNLTKNAFEAIVEAGTVTINTGIEELSPVVAGFEEVPRGKVVYLRISDNGDGIKPADHERIFDPFFSRKKKNGGGTGLGLSMVYGIVKDMSGSIELDSERGVGSTFTVRFPVAGTQVDDPDQQVSDLRGNERLLIIDDLESQRELGQRLLNALGYNVFSASHGTAGIYELKHSAVPYDLVIIDMMMGEGADGLDTYRMIQEVSADVPCLLASGYSETERVNLGLQEGVKAFVRKPYTQAVLGAVVRKALDNE